MLKFRDDAKTNKNKLNIHSFFVLLIFYLKNVWNGCWTIRRRRTSKRRTSKSKQQTLKWILFFFLFLCWLASFYTIIQHYSALAVKWTKHVCLTKFVVSLTGCLVDPLPPTPIPIHSTSKAPTTKTHINYSCFVVVFI